MLLANLKRAKTLIFDAVCMPDIRILCVSTVERDLRFYDTSASGHTLRMRIIGLDDFVCTLKYYWSTEMGENSRLLLGDEVGNVGFLLRSCLFNLEPRHLKVFMLEFDPHGRGPFTSGGGKKMFAIPFRDLLKVFALSRFKGL